MKNLISMTDYIIQQHEQCISSTGRTYNYAKFLKQPLELGFFVPCDEDGNVLEEKSIFNTTDEDYIFNSEDFDKYQQAKERCLFEGFESKHIKTTHDNYYIINNKNITWLSWNNSKRIENLLDYNQDLQLTQTAIKQLGL